MIRVENLKKSYGDLEAVKGLSLHVEKGESYGFLGPNGAGKTTSISMMSGILKPNFGRVLIDDADIWQESAKVKRTIGVVPQETALYEELSSRDNLRFWGRLYGLSGRELRERVDAVLSRVGLSDRAREPVDRFSGGMKRRLNLAMGLVHRPRVLFLDEPTVGIDPQARLNILDLIREEASRGVTVFYTTHYLEEAQDLCDRLSILDHGEMLAEGSVEELTSMVGSREVMTLLGDFSVDQVQRVVQKNASLTTIGLEKGRVLLSLQDAKKKIPSLLDEFARESITIESLSVKEANLQDVFLKLTGRELRD